MDLSRFCIQLPIFRRRLRRKVMAPHARGQGFYCFILLPFVERLESGLVLSDAPGNWVDEPDIPVESPVEPDDFSFFAAGLLPTSALVDGLAPCDVALVFASAAMQG